MTIHINNLLCIRFEVEPYGSFAVEGTIGNFKDIPFIEGTASLTLSQDMESPGHAQQYIDGHPARINLPKRAQLDFSIPLSTLDTKPTGQAVQGGLGELLKVAMGGEWLGTGTTVNDAGATTTDFDLTSVAGVAETTAIGLATGSNSELEVREIKTESGSNVALKHALTNAPANAATVWAAATYYLTGIDGSETLSGQFAVEGTYTEDSWLLSGGQVNSMRIELPIGGLPRVVFSWRFADWDLADGTNTTMDLTAASIVGATYVNTKSIVLADSEFRIGTVGTNTIGTLYHPSEITFEPNLVYVEQMTPAGTNTVKQYIRLHQPPVIAGSFVLPYEAATFRTSKDASTAHSLTLQIGTSSTDGAIYLTASNVQIVDVQPMDAGGIRSQRVSWVGRHDTDFSDSTSAFVRSAFRIHLI